MVQETLNWRKIKPKREIQGSNPCPANLLTFINEQISAAVWSVTLFYFIPVPSKKFIRQVRARSHFWESIESKEGSKNHEVPRIERVVTSAAKVLQVCK